MKATLDDSPIGQHDECAQLFVLATLGDLNAAHELYSRCVPPLRTWLAARIGWSLAEDISHDAFVMAFRKGSSFRAGSRFGPWLRAIAWNLAQNAFRTESRRQQRETQFFEHQRLHGQHSASDERRRRALEASLAELPTSLLHLVRSRYFAGKSSEEIAAEQGRTRGAVAVNLHRICRSLRADIERRETQACGRGECPSHAAGQFALNTRH